MVLNFISAVAYVLCMMELLSDEAWVCMSGGMLYQVFLNIIMICEVCRFERLL